jgi:large subunit ribosomal protein L29
MSSITTAAQLRDLSQDDLATKLAEAKEELFNLRFQAATGQLESHGRLRTVRRDIARIYTVLRERELGITEPVGGPEGGDESDEGAA